MTAEALGIDTPQRLSHIDWHGHPVFSIYLDPNPTRFAPQPRATRNSARC